MAKLARRNFLQVMCISPLGLRVDLADADEVKSASEVQLREALARREAMEQQWLTAYEKLPEWVRPGHRLTDEAGFPAGDRVGWPKAGDSDAIDLGCSKLVRPSPRDLWQLYQANSVAKTEEARAIYRNRCWQLIRRMRERRECLRSYGMPTSADFTQIDAEIDKLLA